MKIEKITRKGYSSTLSKEQLWDVYKSMKTQRLLEDRLLKMYKGGQLSGAVYPGIGQEASMAGIAAGRADEDLFDVVQEEMSTAEGSEWVATAGEGLMTAGAEPQANVTALEEAEEAAEEETHAAAHPEDREEQAATTEDGQASAKSGHESTSSEPLSAASCHAPPTARGCVRSPACSVDMLRLPDLEPLPHLLLPRHCLVPR